MSASWPGSMRGPWAKTPLLLLLLLLLSALTRTVLCENEEEEGTEDVVEDGLEAGEAHPSEEPTPLSSDPTVTNEVNSGEGALEDPGSGHSPTEPDGTADPTTTESQPEPEPLSPIIILIPVVLVVLIIAMIVCGIVINRRWNKKARDQGMRKEDPYLDGSSTEKVPMPMFEEDVPSVLELEMDELDQWMKKDGEAVEDSKPT